MRFFVQAVEDCGPGVLTLDLPAPTFEAAAAETRQRASREFHGRAFRITQVVENPEFSLPGPTISMRLCVDAGWNHGEHGGRGE